MGKDTYFTGCREVQEAQKHIAEHLVPGRSLLLFLGHSMVPMSGWPQPQGPKGPAGPVTVGGLKDALCGLWHPFAFFLLSDFQSKKNQKDLLIVLPFKFSPPHHRLFSETFWAIRGIQFGNDKIPAGKIPEEKSFIDF